VDCAPTAETLRLLSVPDTGRWWFDHLFPIGRRATLMLTPLARPFLDDIPIPDHETLDAAEGLFEQLGDLHQLLANPELTSVRLVLNPEKMVIKEAQRTYTYLGLYGYVTDAVICNRVIPEDSDRYFATWRETQARYLQMTKEAFAPVPILQAPYFENEVVGFDALRRMADVLFSSGDPARHLSKGQAHTITKREDGFILGLLLPFSSREEISMIRSGDEQTVQVGNWRRNLVLPRALHNLKIKQARFSGQTLNILFVRTESKRGRP
jgi:arsenite-transporting ATPase